MISDVFSPNLQSTSALDFAIGEILVPLRTLQSANVFGEKISLIATEYKLYDYKLSSILLD